MLPVPIAANHLACHLPNLLPGHSGQTGTGKTHTMLGNHGVDITDLSDPVQQRSFGIVPRAVRELFAEAKALQ